MGGNTLAQKYLYIAPCNENIKLQVKQARKNVKYGKCSNIFLFSYEMGLLWSNPWQPSSHLSVIC